MDDASFNGEEYVDSTSDDVASEAYPAAPPPHNVPPPPPPVNPPPVPPNPPPAQPIPPFQADVGMGALMTQAFVAAMAARDQYHDPWMIVDRARRLGAYDFEGSIDGGIADEWLKKLDKAFVILGLTEVEKVQNVHGFVKGIADDWLARIRRLYGEDLTWDIFVTEFHKEYLTGSYKKGKQEAFFKLTQGSLSIREYADQFEDLYHFVTDIMPSEEIKCDRFRSGLQGCM